MKLVIREYLGMLRESGEFDQLMPDLLLSQSIVPLAKPQIGVRQAGVDLAAVGNDDSGTRTLWLFILKRGDIGRREWNVNIQSVRQSLDEVRDVYLRNHVDAQHSLLPVKIVVATTGDRKQEIEEDWVGYVSRYTEVGRVEYEFWGGDEVAARIEKHLFNEYALPSEARNELRRALALVGQTDYDMQHFHALLNLLLGWETNGKGGESKADKQCVQALITTNLALAILCRWAGTEGNLKNAVVASERTLLWAWNAIQRRKLAESMDVMHAYVRLVSTYLNVTVEYFNKLQPYFHVCDGIARYHSEAILLTKQVFDQIGFIATIGLSHLLWAVGNKDDEHARSANFVSETLEALIRNHRCSGSPCYDDQVTDINLALLLFCSTFRSTFATEWLRELISRLIYSFQVGRWFPISTDSFDDLIQLEINRSDIDLSKLQETSWMVATIAQWAAVLGEDEAYHSLFKLQNDKLKQTCLQLWYPDEKTNNFIYMGPAHHESGMTEAPLVLPPTAREMRVSIQKARVASPIDKRLLSSAATAGLPFLDLIASRHFRTPVDPACWQLLNSGEGLSDETVV